MQDLIFQETAKWWKNCWKWEQMWTWKWEICLLVTLPETLDMQNCCHYWNLKQNLAFHVFFQLKKISETQKILYILKTWCNLSVSSFSVVKGKLSEFMEQEMMLLMLNSKLCHRISLYNAPSSVWKSVTFI